MADSDPKKLRSFGQAPDRRSLDSDEDPLVELARIVSEDGGFHAGKTAKAEKPRPRDEPIDRNAFSADLEAELLQELESSFATRAAPSPTASRTPQQAAPSQAAADDSDDLLRSIEEQLGEFERRAQTSRIGPAAATRVEPVSDHRFDAQNDHEDARTQAGAESEDDWAERSDETTYSADEPHPVSPARNAKWRETPAQPAPTRRDRPAEDRKAGADFARRRDDAAELERLERRAARERRRDAGAPVSPVTGTAGGWNEITAQDEASMPQRGSGDWRAPPAAFHSEMRTTFGDMEEAPDTPRADADMASVETELTRELEPSYADPSFGGHWQDAGGEGLADEPRVAAVPSGAGAPMGARASAQRGRSRKALVTAIAVLGVVVIGGGVAAYMRSGASVPTGTPPVISASEDAVRIEAPQQDAAADTTVGEAVYNRVAGDAPSAEEQVVDGAEEPREISRIVLPPPQAESDQALVRQVGEGGTAAAGTDGAASADAGEEDLAVGPRRVRTYVVRPDGTIVATGDAPAGEASAAASAQETQIASVDTAGADTLQPVPVQTREVDESGAMVAPMESAPDTAPATTAPLDAPAAPPAVADTPPDAPVVEDIPPPAEMTATQPPAVTPAPEVVQPRAEENGPVDLLTGAPAQEQPATAPSAAGGYLVQVSSQRSAEDARSSFASMQSRYPSVLGNLQADVQRADLGEKGIYYRVRVGPWTSRAEAIEVCESLQAAGASCFVTR